MELKAFLSTLRLLTEQIEPLEKKVITINERPTFYESDMFTLPIPVFILKYIRLSFFSFSLASSD